MATPWTTVPSSSTIGAQSTRMTRRHLSVARYARSKIDHRVERHFNDDVRTRPPPTRNRISVGVVGPQEHAADRHPEHRDGDEEDDE